MHESDTVTTELHSYGSVPTRDCTHAPHRNAPTYVCTHTSLHPHIISPTRDFTHTELYLHEIVHTQDCTHTGLHPHRISPTRDFTHTGFHPHGIALTRDFFSIQVFANPDWDRYVWSKIKKCLLKFVLEKFSLEEGIIYYKYIYLQIHNDYFNFLGWIHGRALATVLETKTTQPRNPLAWNQDKFATKKW